MGRLGKVNKTAWKHMDNYFNERYKFTHRLEGIVNAFGEDIAQTLEGALEKVSGKLIRLTAAAEKTTSLAEKRELLLNRKAEIENVLAEIYRDMGEDLKAKAVEVGMATPEIINDLIESSLPEGVSAGLSIPHVTKNRVLAWWDSNQIEGAFFNDFLKKMEANAAERVLKAARENLILGQPLRETAKELQNALDIGRNSAMGLARTAVHGVVNWSEREFFEENVERFKSYRFQAELDRGTCELCAFLDGGEYTLSYCPQPPIHFSCRCWIYPVMQDVMVNGELVPFEDAMGEEYDKVARRISRLETDSRTIHHKDGTTSTAYRNLEVKFVDRNMTYRDWLQSMVTSSDPGDVAFAREALGPTRFKLVKSGELKVESLYYQGKLRTIEELKELMQ